MKKIKPQILVFIGSLVVYAFFCQITPYDNVAGRLDLTRAIVELGTLNIDAFHANTVDKALYNGHFYCDKAPGVSILAVPIHFLIVNVFQPMGLFVQTAGDPNLSPGARYIIRMFAVSLPASIMLFCLFKALCILAQNKRRLWLGVSGFYLLGTLALPYGAMFYGHQTAAAFGFISFYLLWRHGERAGFLPIFAAGFLAGYMIITEFPSAVIGLGLLGYITAKSRNLRTVSLFCLGGVIPLFGLAVYNNACFAGPFDLAYAHKYAPHFQDVHGSGFYGISTPHLAAIRTIFFSMKKGLFVFSPFLILAGSGLFRLLRNGKIRLEAAFFLYIMFAYCYCAASFSDWNAGWTLGPRHLTPMIPFVIPGLVGFFQKRGKSAAILFIGLALPSAAVNILGVLTSPHTPLVFDFPFRAFHLDLLSTGYLSTVFNVVLGAPRTQALILSLAFFGAVIFTLIRWALSEIETQSTGRSKAAAWLVSLTAGAGLTFLLFLPADPVNGPREYQTAQHLLAADLTKAAVERYRRATEASPFHSEYRHRMGDAFMLLGDENEALETYRMAIRLNPGDGSAHRTVAYLFYKRGCLEEARKHAAQAMKALPDDPLSFRIMQAILAKESESRQRDPR